MEKVLNAMPTDQQVKAERILEINPDHEVMKTLQEAYAAGEDGKEKVKTSREPALQSVPAHLRTVRRRPCQIQ